MTNKHLWPHPTLEEQFEALYAREAEIMNALRQVHQSLSVLKDSMIPKFSADVANVVRLSIMQRDNAEQERNQAMIIVGEQKAELIKAEWNATQARVTAEQARATAMEDARRFDWFFGPDDKTQFMPTYLKGLDEKWTVDQWREAIDAALKDAT